MDKAHTWYINLIPGSVHDLERSESLFNTKSFYDEEKLSLVELGRTM